MWSYQQIESPEYPEISRIYGRTSCPTIFRERLGLAASDSKLDLGNEPSRTAAIVVRSLAA
jgi:hypothetical protein